MIKLWSVETKLTEFVNKISSPWTDIINSKEATEIDKKYTKERYNLFGEVAESAMARRTPWLSKVADLLTSVGIKKWDPEVVRWQKEFESITAWTMVVPDSFLEKATNPLLKIPWFTKLIKNYPLWWKVKRKLLDDKGEVKEKPDPDDIVNFLRIVNQDIITGKVVYKKTVW